MKCPFCDNKAAYLCDNVTDPLNPHYYCDKCNTVFTEGGMMVDTGPKPDIKVNDQTAKADGGAVMEERKCEECLYLGTKPECFVPSTDPELCVNYQFDSFIHGDDQTAKADKGKPKLTLVPRQIIYDIAEVREYGNNKYPEGGPDNWKKVDRQRYRDALFRHLLLYLDDPQGVDEESGIKHLKHIACNVAFLCEIENYADEYVKFYDTNGRKFFEMKVGDTNDTKD